MAEWTLHKGDSMLVLPTLQPESVDAIITDPPAGVGFMGRDWDRDMGGRNNWIRWLAMVMKKAGRALKPGGYAIIWSIPRTSHWTGMALEMAGFEVRDCVHHLFGSGMPKGLNVGKAIDAHLGAEREKIRIEGKEAKGTVTTMPGEESKFIREAREKGYHEFAGDKPVTPEAEQWDGWHTALKPAIESWWLVRKPLESEILVENLFEHGVGALNIREHEVLGRWPTNLILSHSVSCEFIGYEEVEYSGTRTSQKGQVFTGQKTVWKCALDCPVAQVSEQAGRDIHEIFPVLAPDYVEDSPFYRYVTKVSPAERDMGLDDAGDTEFGSGGSHPGQRRGPRKNPHTTVKSMALMDYFIRLVTPPGGTVLDPFTGSGTTAMAAVAGDFNFVGIEMSDEYHETATRRIQAVEKELKKEQAA